VAASGDTVLVGAPGDHQVALDSGAAIVYVRDGEGWTTQAEAQKPRTPTTSDNFGTRVALSGDALGGRSAERAEQRDGHRRERG
jgi:hypothetical protein